MGGFEIRGSLFFIEITTIITLTLDLNTKYAYRPINFSYSLHLVTLPKCAPLLIRFVHKYCNYTPIYPLIPFIVHPNPNNNNTNVAQASHYPVEFYF